MHLFESNRHLCTTLFAVLLAGASTWASAQCHQTATTTSDTTVHSSEPAFSTAGGWQLAEVIATLPAGTQVSVCEHKDIGLFGIGTRTWLRIQFDGGRSGWVFKGNTNLAAVAPASPGFRFSLISEAVAAESTSPGNGLPSDALPGSGLGRWLFLMIAALCVLLGIIGKLIYDGVGDTPRPNPIWRCVKIENCIKAVIAAPLALTAFLQIGDFTLKSETATLVCLCMAFQNGFFWQTLLPPVKSAPKPAPAGNRRATD